MLLPSVRLIWHVCMVVREVLARGTYSVLASGTVK